VTASVLGQSARCMDCGVPFCHSSCPLGNRCPEWNDFVHKGEWENALRVLEQTNNFPEFTGTLCPALCEGGCVLGINNDPVTIKNIELSIIEKGFENGWIKPLPPKMRTGKKVAVVGSGPAGLATAQQLNRAGHSVTLFERDDKAGGLLTYGIPDFKIEKWKVERRVKILEQEGVEFIYNTNVGVDITTDEILAKYDAVVLAGGSKMARDLPVFGRDLKGTYYAMEYLAQQNAINAGKEIPEGEIIDAKGKNVLVIGGGDTGSDCVGTATRQGAESVYQIELLSKPSLDRQQTNPWPNFPLILKTSTSHNEANKVYSNGDKNDVREWDILTKEFTGENGILNKFHAARVEWVTDENGKRTMKEIPNSQFALDIDLVFLAIGFVHPEHEGLINSLGVELDPRGNVKTGSDYKTSCDKVFAAGDMRKGQSLIVHAINEGRRAAKAVDEFLIK